MGATWTERNTKSVLMQTHSHAQHSYSYMCTKGKTHTKTCIHVDRRIFTNLFCHVLTFVSDQ